MKFFTFTVLALVALVGGEAVQERRGVAASQAYAAPASVAYTKLQQPVQKTVVAAQQPQFYAQPAAAAYSVPAQQQLQYEPQALTYAQPQVRQYAAAPAPAVAKVAYRPQFSLANDVSTFAYTSPVVSYNNLGLLSQVLGKGAPAQTKVAAAPAPAVYQSPAQKFSFAQPVTYAAPQQVQTRFSLPATQTKLVSAPQQYLTQSSQPTYLTASQAQAYAAPQTQTYSAPQTQTYSAPQAQTYSAPQAETYSAPQSQTYSAPQSQTYSAPQAQAYSAGQQTYTSQSIPQPVYSQAPQFFGAQQLKQQLSGGVAYGQ